MKNIAVFCGSETGENPLFCQNAIKLARELIRQNMTLIYGGAKVGLMGVLAEEMLRAQAQVIGVMPQALVDAEVAHDKLSELHIVSCMHERKALIERISSAFVILPGGIGTMDEFFEIFTWSKLGIHKKPIGILNVDHYFDPIFEFMDKMIANNFLPQYYWDRVIVAETPTTLIAEMQKHQCQHVS